MTTLPAQKALLRAELRQLRKTYRAERADRLRDDLEALAGFATRVLDLGAQHAATGKPFIIASFKALGNEISPQFLENALLDLGQEIVWPRVLENQLEFCGNDGTPPFVAGAFGVLEPGPGATRKRPDLLIVPLIGCDTQGYRLGQGGGFYDQSIARLRKSAQDAGKPRPITITIGIGFDCQLVQVVPREPHDLQLHAMITPSQFILF